MSYQKPKDDHLGTRVIRKLTAKFVGDSRVEGMWLEGDSDTINWPPYAAIDLHLAIPEPSLASFAKEFQSALEDIDTLSDFSQQEAPLKGFAGTATLSDGMEITYRIERTSQIAKVPRQVVNVLLDSSAGLLIPALSFESP